MTSSQSYFLISGHVLHNYVAPVRDIRIHTEHLNGSVSPKKVYEDAMRHGSQSNIIWGAALPTGHEYVEDVSEGSTSSALQSTRTGAERINRSKSREIAKAINRSSQRASKYGSVLQHALFARGQRDNKLCCFLVDAAHTISYSTDPPTINRIAGSEHQTLPDVHARDLRSITEKVQSQISERLQSANRKRTRRSWEPRAKLHPTEENRDHWGDIVVLERGGLPADRFGVSHVSRSGFSTRRPCSYVKLFDDAEGQNPILSVCLFYAKSTKQAFIQDPRVTLAMYKHGLEKAVRPLFLQRARALTAFQSRKDTEEKNIVVCEDDDDTTPRCISVRCQDGTVRMPLETKRLSSLIQNATSGVIHLPGFKSDVIQRVKNYAEHYCLREAPPVSPALYGSDSARILNNLPREKGPSPPRAPIFASKTLKTSFTDQWGAEFIENAENQTRIFDIAIAAFVLEIHALKDLACAHIATRIVNETRDSVVGSVAGAQNTREYPEDKSPHNDSRARAAAEALTNKVRDYLPRIQRAATLCIDVKTPYSKIKWQLRDFVPSIVGKLSTRLTFAKSGNENELALSTVPRGLSAGVWFNLEKNVAPVLLKDKKSICNGGEFHVRANGFIDGYKSIARCQAPEKSAGGGHLTNLCYDIECSSTEDAQFPDPRRDTNGVIVIAATVHSGLGEDLTVHIFALRHLCGEDGKLLDSSVAKSGSFVQRVYFEGKYPVQVYPFLTEEGLHLGFIDFVKRIQPDVMMGWNSAGFDLPYLMQRLAHIQTRNRFKNRWTTFMSLFGQRAVLEKYKRSDTSTHSDESNVHVHQQQRRGELIMDIASESSGSDDDDGSEADDIEAQCDCDGLTQDSVGESTGIWTLAMPSSSYTHVLSNLNRGLAFHVTGPPSRKPMTAHKDALRIVRVNPKMRFRFKCSGIDTTKLWIQNVQIEFSGWLVNGEHPSSALEQEQKDAQIFRLRFERGGTTLLNVRLLYGLFCRCFVDPSQPDLHGPHFARSVAQPGIKLISRIVRTLSPANASTRTKRSHNITVGYRTMGLIPGQLLNWRRDRATRNLVIEGGTGVTMADLLHVARKKGWKRTKFKGGLKLANVADFFLGRRNGVNAIAKLKICIDGYSHLSTISAMNHLHFDMFPNHDKEDVLRYCFIDALIVAKLSVLKDFNYGSQILTKCRIYGMPSIAVAAQFRDFAQFKFLLGVAAPREGFILDAVLPNKDHRDALDLKLPGALVMAPKVVGKRYERMTILDFLSMYPSIMILYMLCMSTRTGCSIQGPQLPPNDDPQKWGHRARSYLGHLKQCFLNASSESNGDFKDRIEDCARECDAFDRALRKRTARALIDEVKRRPHRVLNFVAPLSGCKSLSKSSPEPVGYVQLPGLIDTVLRILFYERNATKAKIKAVKKRMQNADSTMVNNLKKDSERFETLSLEQKIAMNTVYGVLKFLDPNMLATVTMWGRCWLKLGEKWCHSLQGGDTILADTDGLGIQLPPHPKPSKSEAAQRNGLSSTVTSSVFVQMLGTRVTKMSSDNALRAMSALFPASREGILAQGELFKRRMRPGRCPPEKPAPIQTNAAGVSETMMHFLEHLDKQMDVAVQTSIEKSSVQAQVLADKLNVKYRHIFCPRQDTYAIDISGTGKTGAATNVSKQPGDPYLEMDYAAHCAIGVKAKRYLLLLKSKFKASGMQCGKTTMCEFARTLHLNFFDCFIRKEENSAWEIILDYFRELFKGTLPLHTLASVCMYNPDVNPDLKSAANAIAKQIKRNTGRQPGKERMVYLYEATPTQKSKTDRAVLPYREMVVDMIPILMSIYKPNFTSGKGGSDSDMVTVLRACHSEYTVHWGPPRGNGTTDVEHLVCLGAVPHPSANPEFFQLPSGLMWLDVTKIESWRGSLHYLIVRCPSTQSVNPTPSSRCQEEILSEASSDEDMEKDIACADLDRSSAPQTPLVLAEYKGVYENGTLCGRYTWRTTEKKSILQYSRRIRKKFEVAVKGDPDPVAELSLAEMVLRLWVHAQTSAQSIARMQYKYSTLHQHKSSLDPINNSERWTNNYIRKVENALHQASMKRKRKYGKIN